MYVCIFVRIYISPPLSLYIYIYYITIVINLFICKRLRVFMCVFLNTIQLSSSLFVGMFTIKRCSNDHIPHSNGDHGNSWDNQRVAVYTEPGTCDRAIHFFNLFSGHVDFLADVFVATTAGLTNTVQEVIAM